MEICENHGDLRVKEKTNYPASCNCTLTKKTDPSDVYCSTSLYNSKGFITLKLKEVYLVTSDVFVHTLNAYFRASHSTVYIFFFGKILMKTLLSKNLMRIFSLHG